MAESTHTEPIDINRIMKMIPHRYPILLVDRILEYVPGKSAIGLKNVSMNEPHFVGHFPQKPIMPGVLIVEAMAQTSGLLVVQTLGKEAEGKLVYFMSIDDAKFRKPVVPGDSMYIHVQQVQNRRNIWKFKCEARVEGCLCAEATVTAMLADE
ncbi:MAG: 3-hydroxyacyl-ACP dehydratase FabZ [Rhodospirillales bacterium]|nr:3-hydroxyacyl-ACP dehydratase FabZ [Rhodospirillales bacterium]